MAFCFEVAPSSVGKSDIVFYQQNSRH
jgi:hypothetical protein